MRTTRTARSASILLPPSSTGGWSSSSRRTVWKTRSTLEEIVGEASADSLWQVLVLHGALDGGFAAELLSYERPTYFGMLCAAFEPR